jgi:hypothetical protein
MYIGRLVGINHNTAATEHFLHSSDITTVFPQQSRSPGNKLQISLNPKFSLKVQACVDCPVPVVFHGKKLRTVKSV